MNDPILWTLISIQIFMGAFDTLVHHEGSERLAWRPSQKTELRLHGIRNAFYALIFLVLAWTEPHGLFAIALGGILVTEAVITLWDFVEEDLTRKLPATERINHTLLTLNYGAILAFVAPVLWAWAHLPNAIAPANYGWWSIFATFSALGVGVFGMRDLFAASRSDRLLQGDPADLVEVLPSRQSLLITGGTGFIGQRLVEALVAAGHDVTVLSRDLRKADTLAHPVRLITRLDQIHASSRFDAIINLAGDPIADGLWTVKKRARILTSRVKMTRALDDLIARLETKPNCLVNGSAIGWYGLRGDEMLSEEARPEPAFTHDICDAWETAANEIARHGVRVVSLRIGLVLGVSGGILAKLLTPFEFGGGGQMGDGQQWMSWIAHDDLVRVIAHVIAHPELEGPINATAPNPARNAIFTKALAAALNRPALLRFPAWALQTALGEMARETMLGGQRVVPRELMRHGFAFRYPDLEPMLRDILGARNANGSDRLSAHFGPNGDGGYRDRRVE